VTGALDVTVPVKGGNLTSSIRRSRRKGHCDAKWPDFSGIAAAGLLAVGLIAAAPAYAASATASVQDSGAPQYHVSCNSQNTCNTDTTGTLLIQFNRTGSTRLDLGIFYQITNGTAVDGTDFNVAATGEVIIRAGQFNQDLAVPLVNEGIFGATKSFTIAITGDHIADHYHATHRDGHDNRRQHPAGLLVQLDQQFQPVAYLHSAARDSGVELPGLLLPPVDALPPRRQPGDWRGGHRR
jgi:hypothetical protein